MIVAQKTKVFSCLGFAGRAAAAAAAKEAADKKKKKEKPPAKSLVTLVVKPWEADTNLDELFKLITATEKNGLVWGTACEKEPVAYVDCVLS
jgi:elongation factor 1-beta